MIYFIQFSKEISNIGNARQFIAAVGSSSEIFAYKPQTSDVKELITYIILCEIMENGAYSGTIIVLYSFICLEIDTCNSL